MTIWCVGRNYIDHAKELNNPVPKKPLIFIKSGHSLSTSSTIDLPTWSNEIHYECELALKVDHQIQPVSMALAIDLTARDQQAQLKKQGHPWALAKSFIGSCPISPFITYDQNDTSSLCFYLEINGVKKQVGDSKDMIFSIGELIAHLKTYYPISEGDIILTGTPAGVGSLNSGDTLNAAITGKLRHQWLVS